MNAPAVLLRVVTEVCSIKPNIEYLYDCFTSGKTSYPSEVNNGDTHNCSTFKRAVRIAIEGTTVGEYYSSRFLIHPLYYRALFSFVSISLIFVVTDRAFSCILGFSY